MLTPIKAIRVGVGFYKKNHYSIRQVTEAQNKSCSKLCRDEMKIWPTSFQYLNP